MSNSAFLIVAKDGDCTIGMARVITDYSYIVFIVDVVVHPDYQGNGIGRKLISHIIDYVNSDLSPEHEKRVYLVTAEGNIPFYTKSGFTEKPNETFLHGMVKLVEKKYELQL